MRGVRSRSTRRALGAFTTGILVAVVSWGGCDWFNNPEEANLAPDTFMDACPSSREEVVAGDDVTVEWSGSDVDGTVVGYEWVHDGASGTDHIYVDGARVVSEEGKRKVLAGNLAAGKLGRGEYDTYFPGDIAEVIVYSRALSVAERSGVERYLGRKYRVRVGKGAKPPSTGF